MPLLPVKKTPRVVNINNTSTLIHGKQKIGKSEWCSQIPNVLALLLEPGWTYIEAFKTDIKSWDNLKTVLTELKSGGYKRFGGVCIDTIDIGYDRCAEYICKKYNVSHQSDLSHGKGWGFVSTEFRVVLTDFAQLPIPLFLVSHTKQIQVEARAEKYNKAVPSLSDAPRRTVMGLVDIVLYFTDMSVKGKEVRVVKTKPNKYFEAGDRTGVLPKTMYMEYEYFSEAFEKEKEKEKEKKLAKESK